MNLSVDLEFFSTNFSNAMNDESDLADDVDEVSGCLYGRLHFCEAGFETCQLTCASGMQSPPKTICELESLSYFGTSSVMGGS